MSQFSENPRNARARLDRIRENVTRNPISGFRHSDRLEAGKVWVDSENVHDLATPFGGMKASGIGRDGGDRSFDFCGDTRNTAFPTSAHHVPRLGP